MDLINQSKGLTIQGVVKPRLNPKRTTKVEAWDRIKIGVTERGYTHLKVEVLRSQISSDGKFYPRKIRFSLSNGRASTFVDLSDIEEIREIGKWIYEKADEYQPQWEALFTEESELAGQVEFFQSAQRRDINSESANVEDILAQFLNPKELKAIDSIPGLKESFMENLSKLWQQPTTEQGGKFLGGPVVPPTGMSTVSKEENQVSTAQVSSCQPEQEVNTLPTSDQENSDKVPPSAQHNQ